MTNRVSLHLFLLLLVIALSARMFGQCGQHANRTSSERSPPTGMLPSPSSDIPQRFGSPDEYVVASKDFHERRARLHAAKLRLPQAEQVRLNRVVDALWERDAAVIRGQGRRGDWAGNLICYTRVQGRALMEWGGRPREDFLPHLARIEVYSEREGYRWNLRPFTETEKRREVAAVNRLKAAVAALPPGPRLVLARYLDPTVIDHSADPGLGVGPLPPVDGLGPVGGRGSLR